MSNSSLKTPVCLVVGTRPEAIKMAPVYFALNASKCLRPVLLSTGQHREMLAQALGAFGIRPDHDLDLMRADQSLSGLTASVLTAVRSYLEETNPAAVIVQGDTSTVLASALAAFYSRIPVGHVEAGLRTRNMDSPWPEEMNRRLVAPLCRWNFCPTAASQSNLIEESIPAESCHVTGNTVIDALLWIREKSIQSVIDPNLVAQRLGVRSEFAERFLCNPKGRWILVTGHRRESFGQGFEDICKALVRVVETHPDVGLLYPVHLNPNVREPVGRLLGAHENIELVEPVGYENFVWLMNKCSIILTDSGGVQEEAPSLGKPVIVMRDTTERPEGVTAGTCRLVGSDPDAICREIAILLGDENEYFRRSRLANPYGDGHAADRIRLTLERDLAHG
ncbi:MAG: UDP-N-acetylglucosamine 2-epimerase (non-hydrolyzing) [Verrucomicrobiota bacterium]